MVPCATPVTTPVVGWIVATNGLTEVQVPVVLALNVVVVFIQMLVGPATVTVGLGETATLITGSDGHPLLEVKVKVDVPAAIPVTIPELLTDATDKLELVHTPAEAGNTETLVVLSIHIGEGPAKDTTGLAATVTVSGVEEQEVTACVNTKDDVPAAIPDTTPKLVMVAIPVFELDQVPPVVGDTNVF